MLPSLGEIPKKRKELGLTQSRLAVSAGVSQSIIAKIEAGSVDPSYSVVQRLFSALERAGVESPARRVDELRSEEHTSELQSRPHLVCRLLLEKKKKERLTTLVYNETLALEVYTQRRTRN